MTDKPKFDDDELSFLYGLVARAENDLLEDLNGSQLSNTADYILSINHGIAAQVAKKLQDDLCQT